MGAGQSTSSTAAAPAAPAAAQPPAPSPPSPAAAPAEESINSGSSGGLASFLPPPTMPRAQLVTQHKSQSQSTSVWDSPTSCTRIFDQLWFCLSPVYQAQEYYVTGDFDTCEEKASALYMCLSNKIKKDSAIQEKIQRKLQRRPICVKEGQEEPDLSPVWELKAKPGWY